jgi:hypothetical protein
MNRNVNKNQSKTLGTVSSTEYARVLEDRDYYKNKFKDTVRIIERLRLAFMPDYYLTISCGEPQASDIIVKEIIRKFAPNRKISRREFLKNKFWKGNK